jgi:hypothetical protein
VRRATILAIWMLGACAFAGAQTRPPQSAGAADRHGTPCAQILQMSSADWVAKSSQQKDASSQAVLQAIASYGKCYDARTGRLAASLGKSGKGPLMGARGNFGDFQKALDNFTAKALSAANKEPGTQEAAHAALYEKQFRYAFYQSYEQKAAKQPLTAAKNEKDASAVPAAASIDATPAQAPAATPITEPMTLAKNRFGELLAALPEDKRREIHRAFGEIFEKGSIGEQWKLDVYRYAISILESPKDTPFSPPPF